MNSKLEPIKVIEEPHRNEITKTGDLIDILSSLGEVEKGKTRFFRGHANSDYLMQPSIYRQSYLIENEDKIIRDALTYCPTDFSSNNTLFEKLVKLQHYGYSTRLLDLTTNALVALYFAAASEENKDGEIIILDIPNEEIKYDDSDTVAILSAISLQSSPLNFHECLKNSEEIQKNKSIKNIMLKIKEISELKSVEDNLFELIDSQTEKIHIKQLKNILQLPPETLLSEELIQDEILNIFNQQKEINSLLHDIRKDKPSFSPRIYPEDMQKVLCVRAKLNNARIIQQQGAFLLFGIKDNKLTQADVPESWQKKHEGQKITVLNKHKKEILKELKSFGISKQTLFPELDSRAQEIMNQYKSD